MSQKCILIFISFLLSSHSFATVKSEPLLSSDEKRTLIVQEIKKGISKEFNLKCSWNENGEDIDRDPVVVDEKIVVKKKSSRGENKVEQMLRVQREKIKKMREAQKAQHRSDTARAKSETPSSKDWMSQKSKASSKWMQDKINEQSSWQKKKLEVLNQWARSKEKYKKELPEIKKDLTDLSEFTNETIKVTKAVAEAHTPNVNQYSMHLIKENFELPIRSQGLRSTCSAFAAVRSMEILAKRKGRNMDLSEQYFYYASKPKCQKSPCTKKGSWPEPAFNFEIPLEKGCPYSPIEKGSNETQIPMPSSCRIGQAKVSRYSRSKTRNEIQQALREGYPVIGGFKLNDAFYKNEGYVFLKGEADEFAIVKDKHAQGHALILVGVMDLPRELWSKQGKHCTLVANSWGEGWGLGGHACLSDAWFDQYRYQFPFLVVEEVALK